ncbi:hypothetical protein HS041_18965 [Planomonospora sp. ID67723]|uniref:hypothetical protein n=1 Tax=Planomonospora sp. ID67723 TaxID=2738134 RepID=UPI0018C3F438|nr:hypothetical protein [Planomonospora sp. ID67723]MBG0829850.1 hypothetical protein [Planomonospora sp. ID67723]
MSSLASRLAVATLATALGGALPAQSPTAADSAAVVTAADSAAVVTAADSTVAGSDVTASVTFGKYVRRGGQVTYKVKVVNRRYAGEASVLVAGNFPPGTRGVKVAGKPRGVTCEVRKRRILDCEVASLGRGGKVVLTVRARLSSAERGTYVAKFGLSYVAGGSGHLWERDEVRFTKFTTRIV